MSRLSRVAGVARVSVWVGALYMVAAPWRGLGGLVSERLRWLEWFVLLAGALTGFSLGGLTKELARANTLRGYARLMRWLLYPPALLSAAVLVVLSLMDRRDPIGVVFTGLLSYWAGLDASLVAVPLLAGTLLPNTRDHPDDTEDAWRGRPEPRTGPKGGV